MRRAVVIVNPAARGGRSAEPAVRAAFAARGVSLEVVRTGGPGDAARIAGDVARGLGADDGRLFVLGGDGTVVEAASALVGSGHAIGILPGGTGNQLARLLRIPLHPARAVGALLAAEGAARTLDLGALDGTRHFALTAGAGIDAAMIAGASPAAKRRFGVGAYVLSGTRAMLAARGFDVRIEADGRVFERRAELAMIANVGELLDGRIGLGPGIAPDDGWLDVCVLSPRGAADGAALAWRMVRRDFRDDPRMLFVRAREVRLEVAADVPTQADGELLAPAPLVARVVPGGARFLYPSA